MTRPALRCKKKNLHSVMEMRDLDSYRALADKIGVSVSTVTRALGPWTDREDVEVLGTRLVAALISGLQPIAWGDLFYVTQPVNEAAA